MKLLVVSDIHYSCEQERERARLGHETRVIGNPLLRSLTHLWRHHLWLRDPTAHNHRLAQIIAANPNPDLIVANGDFTLDSAFVGVSDDAACESASFILNTLRQAYGERLLATIGDHDLGKKSLFGNAGGPRFTSLECCQSELGLAAFWRRDIGNWVLLGTTSTALAWPVFEVEGIAEESSRWRNLRDQQMAAIRAAFAGLHPEQRVLLFVHDPTALPFLWSEEAIRSRLHQVERTIIGHLHSPAILRLARILAGMPRITWLGATARRHTSALREARCWRDFKVTLCPSPAGCQLLKDGGWLELELEPDATRSAQVHFKPLVWQ
jgi:hypothetical protein